MRKIFTASGFAALILAAASLSACVPEMPGLHKHNTAQGWRCTAPAKGSNIVGGFFRAWHNTASYNTAHHSAPTEQYRCFRTIEDCQAWQNKLVKAHEHRKPEAQFCKRF